MKKDVIIVGAGPGGLTAGMILAHRGYNVTIYEKSSVVGGRNAALQKDGFTFDTGPTFLMFKPVLEEIFQEAGAQVQDYLQFYDLDPMYQLVFRDVSINIYRDHEKMRSEIQKKFPGEEAGFDKFLSREKERFELALPCLQKDYSKFSSLFNRDLLRFIPRLSFPNSMYKELGKYFKSETLKMAFTFQSKYLGMSPWQCPAAFLMIPFIEHHFGIQHVRGGLSNISEAMKNLLLKNGGKIVFNETVEHVERGAITLSSGTKLKTDRVIINADVGYAMKKWFPKKDLSHKKFSCSTFMLYLGINQKVNLEHHTIFFSDDYKKFAESISRSGQLTSDISFYIRNASPVDETIAPKDQSNIYVLVPVPNNASKIDWQQQKTGFRNLVLDKMKERTGFDFQSNIVSETMITPQDWEDRYNVFLGATFNLAHTLDQMLYFRPHNKLAEDLYLVGGGTNPGSGLPTIYESGRVTANIITKEDS